MDQKQILETFFSFFGLAAESSSPLITESFASESGILSQIRQQKRLLPDLNNADLYLGCPLSTNRRELTARTLFWCPHGWPDGRFTCLASSRLGNRLRQDPNIAYALRNFFLNLHNEDVVVSGPGVTLDQPVQRGCQLFERHLLRFIPLPKRPTPKWIEQSMKAPFTHASQIYFDSATTTVDDLMFAVCDQVRVVDVRKNGRIWRLIQHHHDPDSGPVIMIYNNPDAHRPNDLQPLRDLGCLDWYLCRQGKETRSPPKQLSGRFRLHAEDLEGEFLNHWTRAERKPWPDQSSLSQFDSLFFSDDSSFGPLRSLCRILAQRTLMGSGRLVHGGQRIVCFTEVPLTRFPEYRVFRPQLSRWDFEPFGISIRRSVIEGLQGRPVKYVDRPRLNDASQDNRPFEVVSPAESGVDWSIEREWRVPGDIDLRKIGPDDAAVFVPDQPSAEIVAGLSRWPVVILTDKATRRQVF